MTYGDWNEPCYPLCGTGQSQSPINITASIEDTGGDLLIAYQPQSLDILNDGLTIKVICTQQSAINYGDQRFALEQFHFHYPSEHTIDGRSYPMELHLVHRSEAGGFLVLAVMIEGGGDVHNGYKTLCHHLPKLHDERCKFSNLLIDPATLLPANLTDFYRYDGSLTTPPCTEHVHWFVLAEPVTISDGQLTAFHALVDGNNRPLQALNGRLIYHHH